VLISAGRSIRALREIFRVDGAPLSLYKHQEQAIALASQGESYVVTTGTGSGKSLCFFIPIVSAVLAEKRRPTAPRTRAIIIYPMNALANSQLEELDKFIKNVGGAPGHVRALHRAGRQRRAAAHRGDPPDILLTNFMMLELLMTRQDEIDRKVIGNCQGLRFLVLDELHTYRGRQGADVALLVRRVRERLAPEQLQCIGTSATMASEGSLEDKSRVVAAWPPSCSRSDRPEQRHRRDPRACHRLGKERDVGASGLGPCDRRGAGPDHSRPCAAHTPPRDLGRDPPRRVLVGRSISAGSVLGRSRSRKRLVPLSEDAGRDVAACARPSARCS
jgi:hypothetical protein